ncbi:hypothetical protein SEA_CHANGELING_68 [Mycobacterium phage Changeling]|nr:hypothetical protein BJD71_gp63 [Mycobacterium phage ArcherNM]AMS01057.1 hypothetical protein SEA_ARCHERNM_63 [Mycobacterium phage ArcherNM]ASR86520.1 hypothetical protein SEA_CHANGELING_68 [Mycobacterium phage Changeling]
MTLFEQIKAILLRHGVDVDDAAEEMHALIIELYGPPF